MPEASLRILPHACGTRPGSVSISEDGSRVDVALSREPMTRADWTTHDYNVHFTVGLENTGESARTAMVSIGGGTWDALPRIAPILYEAAAPDAPFALSERPARTDLGKRYAIRLALAPGETVYIANHLVRRYQDLVRRFDALARDGVAERREIGRSLEDRPIVAYVYGDPGARGTLLVSAGIHPPEPDTLAAEAVMEWLASGEGRALADRLAVAVIPLANPDGHARGSQAANAAGINFYWHFAVDHPDRCPEAAAMWAFSEALAPRGYIDFHGYTFQKRKAFGPYVRPCFFYSDPRVRAAAARIYARMTGPDQGTPVVGFPTYAPLTLGSLLAKRFDTVTAAKFHVHLKDGIEACRQQGLRAFRTMAEGLIAAGLTERARPDPGGWRPVLHGARELWAGCLRPNLGLLRRGRLSELRFHRTGLDAPN